ncbi:hypothetical protein F5Y07DRAFT_360381 [Xylaria sp. FL0933]|nr:hypothetical protein F5Y07DRAFT_360381 [Xylaria sp. FL0933]
MNFLSRIDLYDTVKPYNFQYYPKEDFPQHNINRSTHALTIRSIRSIQPPPSLDVQGFEIGNVKSMMMPDDFQNEDAVQNVYCRELEKYLQKSLPGAPHVRALDYQLRTRDAAYPNFGGKLPPGPQPSSLVHIDTTPTGAQTIVEELYDNGTATQILKARYRIITVWRALRVPVKDWPLTICDASTTDPKDLVPADILYPNWVAENYMVHFNVDQRWYWLPEQKADEVLIFSAFDSDKLEYSACPHTAFPLLGNGESHKRESIDVRLLVMYADIRYPESEPWSKEYETRL